LKTNTTYIFNFSCCDAGGRGDNAGREAGRQAGRQAVRRNSAKFRNF